MLREKSAGLVLALFAAVASAAAQAPQIDRFYVVRDHFSDVVSVYGDVVSGPELLDVAAVGGAVRIRWIRVSGNNACKETSVEAAERVIPGTSVAAITGVDLCAIDEKRAKSALERSRVTGMGVWEGDDHTLVAVCRDRVRTLNLPDSNYFNMKLLRSRDNAVAQAMGMFTRVRVRAFGSRDPFEDSGEQSTAERQKVAAGVIAELQAGRFRQGFGADDHREFVTDPPMPSLRFAGAELLESDTLKFATYQPVRIPQIALTAQVFGDVHLRLTVVPSTGTVSDVAVVSGAPLLASDAVAAARTWRLTPGSATSDQIDVTLRFQPRCGKG